MHPSLLLIDIQNDYFPGGRMELVGAETAARNAALLVERFRKDRREVLHIQHVARSPQATFFLPGTEGAEIHPLVAPNPGEPIFVKAFPNSFRETGLLEHLRKAGTESLVVAGMMSQRCVDTTVRAAFDLGFSIRLAHDACATRDLEFLGKVVPAAQVHASFMAALGVGFARVVSTQEVLGELD